MMCNNWRLMLLAIGLVVFSLFTQAVTAAPTVFFDRDNSTTFMSTYPNSLGKFNEFTASLNSFGIDNIDAAAGMNPTLAFGATGITANTQGVLAQAAPGFQIGSQALLELDAVGFPQVDTVFTFNQYVNAFGAYMIQGGDDANNNPITFRLRNTTTNAVVDVPVQVGPGWGFDNAFFLGVIDTVPFNEVSILESTDADGILYDNIVAGNVPEPGSLAILLLGGICGLGRSMRGRHD